MEIDITRFFYNAEPFDFSGSRLERGNNAAQETWDNALEEAERRPLLTTNDQLDALRDHMRGFGAWDDTEIADWTKMQCNATRSLFNWLAAICVKAALTRIRSIGGNTKKPQMTG